MKLQNSTLSSHSGVSNLLGSIELGVTQWEGWMRLLAKIVFLYGVLARSHSTLAKAPKVHILSQTEIRKLGKEERIYYLQKLGKILAEFEVRFNGQVKMRPKRSAKIDVFSSDAYAEDLTKLCIVGGEEFTRIGRRCSYKTCRTEGGGPGIHCGAIYKSSGACTPYVKQRISFACADRWPIDIDQLKQREQRLNQICGVPVNAGTQGCQYVISHLAVLNSQVQELAQPTMHKYCRQIPAIAARGGNAEASAPEECQICLQQGDMEKCTRKFLPPGEVENFKNAFELGFLDKFTDISKIEDLGKDYHEAACVDSAIEAFEAKKKLRSMTEQREKLRKISVGALCIGDAYIPPEETNL